MTSLSSKQAPPNLAAAKLKARIKPAALKTPTSPKKAGIQGHRAASSKKKPEPVPESTFKGPSLFAILSTKRLVKRFREKVAARKAEREALASRLREPTYRMEPQVKFSSVEVKLAIAEIADSRLDHLSYSAKRCAMITKILTEEIKDAVKKIGYERYKIVCYITLGEKKEQGIQITSRCTWDPDQDNSVTYNWENESMFCCITVFGLYHE